MSRVYPDDDVSRGPLTVYFDADRGICTVTAARLRRLDRGGRLRLFPLHLAAGEPLVRDRVRTAADLTRDLHVIDAHGHWAAGGEAVLRICAVVPALRPLAVVGRLPLIDRLVGPLYALVAGNRHAISRLIGAAACRIPGRGT